MSNLINHFAHPWMLLALVLVPLLLILQRRSERNAPSVLYSDLSMARGLPRSARQRFLAMVPYSRALVLTLGIVALARPQYGNLEMKTSALGVDIALVLDVSGSMMEDDYVPNRLEAAKAAAQAFVKARATDRVSVIVFATSAALLCPPTLDMAAAEQFIGSIHRDMIANGSTAVGDGLGLAVSKLKDSKAKSRVAIVLTDGDSNSGRLTPEQAAETAEALKVRVYTIGLTRGNSSAPQMGLLGGPMFAPPSAGFNEELLKNIAERTGGKYFRANNERSLRQIYQEIDALEKTEIEVKQTADYDERFFYFWLPALALLGLEFLLKAFWLRRLP
ncbi:VWA domain-containing protein [bacterium]|nr:VWA domain-containing protein [bacterium]